MAKPKKLKTSMLKGMRMFTFSVLIAFASVCVAEKAVYSGDVISKVSTFSTNRRISREEEAMLRKTAAHRKRRIIYNNDGGDARVPPSSRTVSTLLLDRTTPLIGSQVDTIIYDTTAGSFGLFAHFTEVGEVFLTKEDRYQYNVTPDFIFNNETDPLRVMLDFAKENNFEFFWTMRMNDTHDESNGLLMSELKKKNPEFLFGSSSQRPPFGRWTGVDYASREIRELAFQYVEEVAVNYDVDGIMLDFFRHPPFFKNVAWGGTIHQNELDLMTALIKRIRDRMVEIGIQRGRPILLAVRVPDSVEYNLRIGLDLERWLTDGLVDLFMPAGTFRLNRWEDAVSLGRKYGVPVYPSLDNSYIADDIHFDHNRNSLESYRARAMNVWQSGADGIHLFNMFSPSHPMLLEIGNPQTLLGKEKVYYSSVRGNSGSANPQRFVNDSRNFFSYHVVAPRSPRAVWIDTPLYLNLDIGEDVKGAVRAGLRPNIKLKLDTPVVSGAEGLSVTLNGYMLKEPETMRSQLHYTVDPDWLVQGQNSMEFSAFGNESVGIRFRTMSSRSGSYVSLKEVDVTEEDGNGLRIRLLAESAGEAKIGSVSIRTSEAGDGIPLPPGFVRAANGYGYPNDIPNPGYSLNDSDDEDSDRSVFEMLLPMKWGSPGQYSIDVILQNRPYPGTYYSDYRTIIFRITDSGEVVLPRVLINDMQLHVAYERHMSERSTAGFMR